MVDDSLPKSPTFHIIREVYDSSNSHERFEAELDKALDRKVDYIIIEPPRLGDETGRWITVGNYLHKTAVASGILSLISTFVCRNRPIYAIPMWALSVFCTSLYTVSWNTDPCCQYQIENDEIVCNKLPITDDSSPVILGYYPNTKTKYLNRSVTLLSTAFFAWQLWRSCK